MNLKISLLSTILENQPVPHKYTRNYMILKNVYDLEIKDRTKFDQDFIKSINHLDQLFNSFMDQIPLTIIERYFEQYKSDFQMFCYVEYNKKELNSDYKILDLYNALEDFNAKVFALACKIANMYNLEIKLNDKSKKETNLL